MNGGRLVKRLLAVVLAFSTLVTLGLYYNGGGGGGIGPSDDRSPQPAALLRADDGLAAEDASNDVVPPDGEGKRPSHRPRPPSVSAAVDRDTCPDLALANTTINTVDQFSQFDFQVRAWEIIWNPTLKISLKNLSCLFVQLQV